MRTQALVIAGGPGLGKTTLVNSDCGEAPALLVARALPGRTAAIARIAPAALILYPVWKVYPERIMANARKGLLTPPPQWRKYLKDWKRVFWKRERRAGKDEAERLRAEALFVVLVGLSLTIGINFAAAGA